MAKVHKAHKKSQKYGFQKKQINLKTLLIVLAVVVVAAIGLKIAYDNYVYGEIKVTAPTSEQLNNIAANYALLNADTTNFYNYYDYYYAMLGYDNDGTDGSNGMHLYYLGNDKADEVYIYIYLGEATAESEVTATGAYGRTTLTSFINGEAAWGQTAVQLQATNNVNFSISVYDADVEEVSDELLGEVIAEIEAIIADAQAAQAQAAEEAAQAAEEAAEVTEEATEATEEAAEVTEEATEATEEAAEVTEEATEEAAEVTGEAAEATEEAAE